MVVVVVVAVAVAVVVVAAAVVVVVVAGKGRGRGGKTTDHKIKSIFMTQNKVWTGFTRLKKQLICGILLARKGNFHGRQVLSEACK